MALVQSGQFWQWSLTWDDVHREFARSHTESRNPFAEGLQATMQPLRNQLATKLDVQGFEPYASSSPLMQLLLFLQQPDTSKWRGYAFTRILSWFDQTRMMTMEAVCKEHFNSKAPTRLSQFIEDAGQCAVGGIGVGASSDALQIVCAVPLDAIKAIGTDMMMSNVYLDTGKSSDESFKRSWQGFLKAYNLMQFLPRTSFATHAGVDCGVYEHIEWKFADGLNDVPFADAHDQEAMIVLEEVLDEFRGAVKSMYDDGLPLPAVLYELQDEHGEIIAEAELAWVDIKCAVMLKEQKDQCADVFIGKGWTVVELDADEKWLSTVRNQIQENDDVTA
jgi:DEAD/DEAH box helicase domain-containing protein